MLFEMVLLEVAKPCLQSMHVYMYQGRIHEKGKGAKSIKLELRVVSSEQSTNNLGVTHFWCSKTGHSQPHLRLQNCYEQSR